MATKTAIIYYSATGGTYKLAQAVAEGAREAGSEVRVLKVKELAPEEAIASNAGWGAHRAETQDIPEATLADLEWADVILLGSPTRYGLPAAQLKQFLDSTGPLWGQGKLVNKFTGSFTSAATQHGGQESTILAMNNTFYHWGSIIVPPAFADPIQFKVGNPYGVSFASNNGQTPPDEDTLASARFQGRRTVEVATRFLSGSAGGATTGGDAS